MSLSKKLRFEVFKRDGFKCQYCGRSAPEVVLHADHIMPVSKGGEDDIMNLVTSCQDCNLGKSDRTLDDASTLAKRQKQLAELNERREQIEMMMEWQRGLAGLDDETARKVAEFWEELMGYSFDVNEKGIEEIKKMIKRFGAQEVLEAMRISADQYFKYDDPEDPSTPSAESITKGWEYISKICSNRRATAGREYMRDIYYARAILRNRLSYVNPYKSVELMEEAHKAGVSTDEIKQITKKCRNWTDFQDQLEAAAERAKAAGGSADL